MKMKHNVNTRSHEQQVQVAKSFAVIFSVHAVTFGPSAILALVGGIIGADNVPDIIYPFVYVTFISVPAIHPMLETCLLGKSRVIAGSLFSQCNKKSTTNAT